MLTGDQISLIDGLWLERLLWWQHQLTHEFPCRSSRQLFTTLSDHPSSKTMIFYTLVNPPTYPTSSSFQISSFPRESFLLYPPCPPYASSPGPHSSPHALFVCLSVLALGSAVGVFPFFLRFLLSWSVQCTSPSSSSSLDYVSKKKIRKRKNKLPLLSYIVWGGSMDKNEVVSQEWLFPPL